MDEVTVAMDAPPERVWALVTDVTQMGRWSPECTGCAWDAGAAGPAVGARFTGRNRRGMARWGPHATGTTPRPPPHFEFEVRESGMRWCYRFEPAGNGTNVTEYREHRKSPPWYIKLVQRSGYLG